MKDTFAHAGKLEWIGMAPARGEPLQVVQEARVDVGVGLVDEHHARKGESKRQVTLIQQEHFPVIAACCGRDEVRPEETRRNLVVSGINLAALRKRKFRVGEVVLEWTEPCDPCSQMEDALGPGGWNAMRGMGGICAMVHEGGTIAVGDAVELVTD